MAFIQTTLECKKTEYWSGLKMAPDSHVSTVGMSAVNMRNSIQKNRQPALLYALDDSLPTFR